MKRIEKNLKLIIPTIIFLTLIINSCVKEEFNLNKTKPSTWEPSIAAPLINTTLVVDDILKRLPLTILEIDNQTGAVTIVYEGQLFSIKASDIISIPDQNHTQNYTLNGAQILNLTGGSVTIDSTYTLAFNVLNGVQIETLSLDSGFFDITFATDLMHDGDIQLTIPSLTDGNGQPFSQNIAFAYSGNPINILQSTDLTGYTFDLTNGNTTTNELQIDYSLTLTSTGNPVNNGDMINIGFDLNNLIFDQVIGDFGQQNIALNVDSIQVEIFNAASGGEFVLLAPEFELSFNNGLGLEVEIDIPTLETRNTISGLVTPILYQSSFPLPFNINAPTNIGDIETTTKHVDSSNSNISAIIVPTPKWLLYEATVLTNPTPPSTSNFVTRESEFTIDSRLELPLYGYARYWEFVDTLAAEGAGEDSEDLDMIKELLLRFDIDNGFPFNIRAQVYTADSLYNLTDSLLNFSNNFFGAASVDGTGRVTQSNRKITDIVCDQNQIQSIVNAKYYIVKAEAETKNALNVPPENVQIFNDYTIKFLMGTKIDAQIKIGD